MPDRFATRPETCATSRETVGRGPDLIHTRTSPHPHICPEKRAPVASGLSATRSPYCVHWHGRRPHWCRRCGVFDNQVPAGRQQSVGREPNRRCHDADNDHIECICRAQGHRQHRAGAAPFRAGSSATSYSQPSQGAFNGLSAICTHQGCTVSKVADGTIDCPCHGSKFNLDGSVPTALRRGPCRSSRFRSKAIR